MRYTVVLSPDPNLPGYGVSCPAMPGALSQGGTREEALSNIAEAMTGWLDATTEVGGAPLEETSELIAGEVAFVLDYRAEEQWPLTVETAEVEVHVAVPA